MKLTDLLIVQYLSISFPAGYEIKAVAEKCGRKAVV